MSVDLNSMTRKELLQLRRNVEKAIETLADREKAAALAAAQKAVEAHGFDLADLTDMIGGGKGKAKKKNPPKYANPADPSQTWTGRGRRPAWVIEAENAGRPLSDLEI